MKYFLESNETIPTGQGFSHFGGLHLSWLALFLLVAAFNCLWYRRMGEQGQNRWKKAVAVLLLGDELFKHMILLISGNFQWYYLPLHLCSINIFLIAIHAWHPTKLLSNFLYAICLPGAVAALLFPSWNGLPLANALHLHSFTAHILLALYPLVLTLNGELKPSARMIPKCLGLLALMAVPIYGLNLLLDCNFMFLMFAAENNPLYWFKIHWGSHLLGFPVIIAGVEILMYLPMELYRKYKKDPKR